MARKKNNKKTENKVRKPNIFTRAAAFLKDDKFQFITGLLLVVAAAYMLIAFTSYILLNGADQSALEAGASMGVKNAGGARGASIAELLINKTFGIPAYFLALLIGIYGLQLMHVSKKRFPLVRLTIICLALTVWLSVFMNFAFGGLSNRMSFYLGGYHGKFVTDWLTMQIGKPGLFIVLLVTAILFCMYLTSNTIEFIRKLFHPGSLLPGKPEEEEQTQTVPAQDIADTTTTDYSYTISNGEVEKEETTEKTEADSLSVSDEESTTEKAEADKKDTDIISVEVHAAADVEKADEMLQPYDPKLDLSRYKYPTLNLLNQSISETISIDHEEQDANTSNIIEALRSFGIEISSIKATVGPTITLYEITPAPGVKISKIKNLEEDIALNLKALGIRIIAPMPGRGTIGIEVPNKKPQTVSMLSVLTSKKFQECEYDLPVAMGKTITNEVYTFDLAKAPHLLVAGATGQGKSVGLNAIITSLLYKKHPAELKLVMVDPKKVELSIYNSIDHHFLAKMEDEDDAIITEVDKVVRTLKSLCKEMDERYDLLRMAGVRAIKDYNAKFRNRELNPKAGHRYLPYIVVVIDEYGDLIMTAGKDVELPICRIAQLARAVGIHMIIATQRPTANIITGTIKANFPTRIAFKVMSPIDSRVILERTGANSLVGRGDMLYLGSGDPVRIQCAFVDTPEVERICEYISKQQGYPQVFPLPDVEEEGDGGASSESFNPNKLDALFEEAAQLVVSRQMGSTSTIQRQYAIGYNRAGRIMDQLEQAGIVGPAQGSKPRQVLVMDLLELEKKLENLKNQS
ncbi:MAG: DNA translocase FtsK 4TM domain-containing protein [Bacteroidaceae bacterium]|nr:DNA translocase FtsK 4TM domain-containing protein [Bacteroidaceae bacterium]